jgi:phosphatidylglycerophosphate synthase
VSELNYEPTSRRPIAGVFRHMARGITDFCVRRGMHPDAISYASIAASLLAAVCFWKAGRWPVLLLIAPGFCYLRLFMNMLDGMVAMASKKASPRGEILNDLPDRASDILIFAGVAHSGLATPALGYWTIILALMTAYVGTLGQAVGARREFGGVMSKPWRMVTLHLGAWITLYGIWFHAGGFYAGSLSILDWTCLLIIVGCAETIWVRLAKIMRTLRLKSQPSAEE